MKSVIQSACSVVALACLSLVGGCYNTKDAVFSSRHGIHVSALAGEYRCIEIMGSDEAGTYKRHALTVTRIEEIPNETYSYKFVWLEDRHFFDNEFAAAMHRVTDDRFIAFGRDRNAFLAIPVHVAGSMLTFYMPGQNTKKNGVLALLAKTMRVELAAHGADTLQVTLKGDVYDQRKFLEKAAASDDNVVLARCTRKV